MKKLSIPLLFSGFDGFSSLSNFPIDSRAKAYKTVKIECRKALALIKV
jgi:hypothetical protein